MRSWYSFGVLGACVLALGCVAMIDPALAGCVPRFACAPTPQPAPGPLIGFGLPLAGAALAALLAVRHFRHKD